MSAGARPGGSTFRPDGEELIYEGSVISLASGRFIDPAGEPFQRDIVHHPGAVSAVPLLDDGTVVMVRQYRAALDLDLLEIPAGKRDVEDEPPEITARRELEEEIGMRVGHLELLAEFYNSPGFCDEHSWVYLARDLVPTETNLQGIEEQHLVIEHVALDDVADLITSGAITDAKSIIGLTLTLRALGR